MDDGTIREDFKELYRLMYGIPLREMDKIIYPVYALCRDCRQSGFADRVKSGVGMAQEL